VVKKSGAIGWGQANAVRLPWAGRPAVLCTVRDITQQKEAEVALLKAYDALEEMVAQRTAALMQANEALKTEIQERKQSEAALRESDQKYKTLVDNLPDIVFATDRLGRITHINLPAETTYGYRASGLIGQQFSILIYSKERARVAGYFRNAIEKRIGIIRGLQFRMVAKDGTTHWVEANLRRHFDESGQFLRTDGVIRDISENKLLLNQLIRSERLAAIGQLAASVAHEINSPLQGMISLVEAMQKSRPDEVALHENLKMLRNAFDNINVTVTNLQELHRLEKDRQKPVSINPIIENTVRLIRSYLKKNRTTVSMQLEDRLPDICVSPCQISQVLMNLINNAVDAMNPASGKRRQEPHGRGGLILISTFQQCDQVVIEVKDTGPGITEADIERIFDPSYTQKKQRGVGVGLSVCHSIIEDHHGTLVAGNLPDGGAVITVKLPINR
jgi:PAS domain S-box-containing protein